MRKQRALVLIAFLALNAIMCACPWTGLRKEDTPIAQPTATVVTPGAKESTVERPSPTPTQVSRATVEPGRGEITVERRTKALDDLASFHESLPGEDPEADRQALVDYMSSRPEFGAAGIAEGGAVWGRFADGRLVIFANKPRPSTTAETKGTGASSIAGRQAVPALFSSRLGDPGRGGDRALDASNSGSHSASPWQIGMAGSLAPAGASGELPASKSAVIVSALDPSAWPAEEFELSDLLTEKGYRVRSFPPTVDALKTVQGAGVFYFDTHGGCGVTSEGAVLCALETRTPYSPENDARYEQDLDADRLLYMRDGLGSKYNYGITDYFVSQYMTFSKDSFVYIAACHSYNASTLLGFQYAGASVYAGWLGAVQGACDENAAMTTFDLLLGTNDYWLEEPPFRPFDYASIWEHLRDVGEDTCGDAKLMFEKLGGSFAILAPSIKNMEVDEGTGPVPIIRDVGAGELTLYGIFGTDPGDEGMVTIEDNPVVVKTWEPDKIVVKLPSARARGGAGDVVVTVRDHESNAVPLTRWHGTFHYAVERYDELCTEPGEMSQSFTFDIYLRADVHPYREKPGQVPIYPGSVPFRAAQDSSAAWSFEGSCRFVALQGPRPDIKEWCTTEQSGSGGWGVCTRGNMHGFSFYGSINAENRTLEAFFQKTVNEPQDFWGSLGAELITECDSLDEPIEGEPYDWLTPLLVKTPDLVLRSFTLNMDDRYNIVGESRDLEPYDTGIEGLLYSSLDWEEILAEYPPDEDTQAAIPSRVRGPL